MEIVNKADYSEQNHLLTRNTDVIVAVAIVGMLVFMVIPLPALKCRLRQE